MCITYFVNNYIFFIMHHDILITIHVRMMLFQNIGPLATISLSTAGCMASLEPKEYYVFEVLSIKGIFKKSI